MKKPFLVISLGILTLSLISCSSSSPPSEQAVQPTPSPSPQASPSPPPTFEQSLQPAHPPTRNVPKVAGLIAATNPEQQRSQVQQGRNDPFAMLSVNPTVQFPSSAPAAKKPGETASVPSVSPRRPSSSVRPLPPQPPQPSEALGVVVSGVMDLPTSPVAIVKAPGESVVRRVTPGSTLSNGQVRVKAIYAGNSNPMVVLEQYGIEVTKRVGESVATPKAI